MRHVARSIERFLTVRLFTRRVSSTPLQSSAGRRRRTTKRQASMAHRRGCNHSRSNLDYRHRACLVGELDAHLTAQWTSTSLSSTDPPTILRLFFCFWCGTKSFHFPSQCCSERLLPFPLLNLRRVFILSSLRFHRSSLISTFEPLVVLFHRSFLPCSWRQSCIPQPSYDTCGHIYHIHTGYQFYRDRTVSSPCPSEFPRLNRINSRHIPVLQSCCFLRYKSSYEG